ncbi:MAG: hypothetical protein ACPGVO_12560 [Spirulinaceae cyanobacterium]
MEAVDVKKQAQQGSMAAIIQILNAQLAEQGVRTRAVLIDGVLQLLCEANRETELAPTELLPRVREILEAIELRQIRRVNVFARIADEQQMLWLEDMARNPDHSILWTKSITLRRPPFWRRWWPAAQHAASDAPDTLATASTPTPLATPMADPPNSPEEPLASSGEDNLEKAPAVTPAPPQRSRSVLRNSLGILALCVISFVLGQYYDQWRSAQNDTTPTAVNPAPDASSEPTASPTPQPTTVVISPTPNPGEADLPEPAASPTEAEDEADAPTANEAANSDPAVSDPANNATPAPAPEEAFAEAVRLAEEASLGGQDAQTVEQWQTLARKWQTASELMAAVPASSDRYDIARDRVTMYQQNSEVAQQEAQKRQGLPTPP